MIGSQTIFALVFGIAAVQEVVSTIIPEKIIGGVIDIVQSHKNKPVAGTQQPYPNYQYPQYQQWNGQSNQQAQGQGFQTQSQFPANNPGQYQNQGQYNYQSSFNQGAGYPQGGNFNNQAYPSGSGQNFNQGSSQGQGQYQGVYQNSNQFQSNQMQNQQGYYNGMGQSNQNQYQGNQFQAQAGQNQGSQGAGQVSQGFLVSGGQQGSGNGSQGPTCVCQAWTKPQPEIYADPVTEKVQKKDVSPSSE
ncbi:putative uncharacterized protein DDB_G0288537 [Danaus plexippus]|uniref:putative uncharacterized protein DDB_G0288537 n=1 Tax=Danaus plexippus TaxID=13037 RepID=UPI002AAF96C8|nr:putative uncharacterized protein DDB_G0288537 [Danaus plexippus]